MNVFMKKNALACLTAMLTLSCSSNISLNVPDAAKENYQQMTASKLSAENIASITNRVAQWQIAQYDPASNSFPVDIKTNKHVSDTIVTGWVFASLYVGLSKWANVSNEPSYTELLRKIAKKNNYLFAPRTYVADDYAIAQLYIDLYEQDKNPEYIQPIKVILDQILSNQPKGSLEYLRNEGVPHNYLGHPHEIVSCRLRWCWADSIFMGPPVWVHFAKITGDKRYLDYADSEFWATTDLLFDQEEDLYFRDTRFFEKREPNGKEVFWGRGNGWVIAGLARVIEQLPKDHVNRAKYEEIFTRLATRLMKSQPEDGYWRSSLLDYDRFKNPETSGTGFITYGLAWGVNNNLLDKALFMPTITKGWDALAKAVHPNGKLGWVQQIAAAPGDADYDDTQLYGVGAFLLAGSEVYQLAQK